jgi:hypothetical protein
MGVIMPTIMTAHMTKTNANSIACQGASPGIIRLVAAPCLAPWMSANAPLPYMHR